MSTGDDFGLTGSGAVPLGNDDPARIGSIPLLGRLGSGGMGRVYLGVTEGRFAAVKQVLPLLAEDDNFLRHFGHELDNLSRLPEGATAPLLASDREARPPWFATAYVPGLTLTEAVTTTKGEVGLPSDALWLLLRETAAALAPVHALDMVHRDLKPSNVMLTTDGVTLIDFGIARAADQSRLTQTGMVAGTPAYMAPEQASGSRLLTGAADVFALGSLLAYASGGLAPFGEGAGLGLLYRIVHEEPDLEALRAADPSLAALVADCLDKNPEGRPTAAELADRVALERPSLPNSWPPALADRLAVRAEFAAQVPPPDVPPVVRATPENEQPTPADGAAAATLRPQRRRSRTLVFGVVPIVVTGAATLIAVQLLPHVSAPGPDKAAPPVTASTTPAASPSNSADREDKKPDRGKKGGKEQDSTGKGDSGTSSGSDDSGEAPGGSTSTSGGSGDSSDSSGGTGSSSGGTATKAPTTAPATGSFRLRNGNDGTCLNGESGSAYTGGCSGASAYWTIRSGAGGTYKLVNKSTGGCLAGSSLKDQAVFVKNCDMGSGRLWISGSGSSLISAASDGCLELDVADGVQTVDCQSGRASQRWTQF